MNRKLLLLLTALLTMAQGVWAWSGSGTQANPYLITSESDWNTLATNSASNTYTGTYFKLTADFTVTTMVGTGSYKFGGIFDGGGHTLTLSYGTSGIPLSSNYATPFSYVDGVTIKNLHVAGNIYTSAQFAGSLMGNVRGNNTISNCWSSVVLTASKSGDGTHGGFAGLISGGTTNFTNCRFDGKLLTNNNTNSCGGFVGWNEGKDGAQVNFTNCLFAPSEVASGMGGNTFSRYRTGYSKDPSFSNAHYTTTFGSAQGTSASGMSNNTLLSNLGSGWEISGGNVVPKIPATFSGSGTQADPYLITSASDWNTLASNVNDLGESYSGEYFKLMNNISVTTMVGGDGDSYVFSGIFDGDGHTITFNSANATEQFIAPFRFISNATIKNLKVAGSVSSNNRFAGGIVAFAKGTSTVTGCMNSTSITINGDISNASNGGIVGMVGASGNLTITGCVFNGEMKNNEPTSSSMNWCGILGLCNGGCTATIRNCLFAPAAVVVNGDTKGNTIYRSTGVTTVENCYYTYSMSSTVQGKMARSITKGDGVSTLAISGDPTATYSVSGITAYSTGIKYNDVYYAGNGDNVSLNLTHADKAGYTFSTYTTTGGSLASATTNSPTLTMPDANVTISAEFTKNEVTLTDGVNLSASGLTSYEGQQCDVTYTREFTSGKTSTVCLPFAYTKQEGDGSFYAFTDIEQEGNEYVATMTEPGETTLAANTPYLFTPAKSSVTFTGTIASVPASFGECTTTSNGWTFKGTYETIQWTEAPTGIYGFSAQDVAEQGISQGEFVKVGEYVRVKPMRCYLQYGDGTSDWAGARGMNRAAADEPLPETIKVRLVSANGDVTAIGTLQTNTGEVTMDNEAWYSLDGRRIVGQPNAKGIYVNNGKKVIIK